MRATTALKPVDIIEEGLVDDFIRGTWERIRYSRLQNAQLNAAAYEGLKRVLAPLVIEGKAYSFIDRHTLKDTYGWRADDLAERWRAGQSDAIAEVENFLTASGISMHEVMAEALSAKMPEMATLESMLRSADERKYTALRELDRRRAVLAQNARVFGRDLEVTELKKANLTHSAGALSGPDKGGGIGSASQDGAAA